MCWICIIINKNIRLKKYIFRFQTQDGSIYLTLPCGQTWCLTLALALRVSVRVMCCCRDLLQDTLNILRFPGIKMGNEPQIPLNILCVVPLLQWQTSVCGRNLRQKPFICIYMEKNLMDAILKFSVKYLFFSVFGGTFSLTSDTKYNQQMVPSSKKTIHVESSHNHNLNSQWLPQRAASSLEFVWFTARKKEKKNRWKEKWRKQSWVWRRSEHNHSESIKRPPRTSSNDEGGKNVETKDKKFISSHIPPWFQTWISAMMYGGCVRGEEKKKVKQTVGKQGRPVCPRLALIGRNKGSVHPKLLSIWDMVHRSAGITFLILWDASSEKWQQRKSVCLWCGCDNPCWQPEQRAAAWKDGGARGTGAGNWNKCAA